MNLFMWILAGSFLGWVGFSFLGYNESRGKLVSILIGAAGGIFGGKMIAPMVAAATVPGVLSLPTLFIAAAVAAAFLAIGNLVHNRWGL